MKLSLFKATIMFVLIITSTAYCQHQGLDFSYFGGGARSEGMGQAYIALSDDGAAGNWNPAGLYIHEKTLMGFSYRILAPRGYYAFYSIKCPIDNDVYRSNYFNHAGTFNAINDWNIISPLRISNHHVVLNISYVQNLDGYFEFREKLYDWSDYDPNDWTDDYDPNAFMQRKGGIHSFNLALGTRIYKQFSCGISANIYTGSVVTDENRTAILDIVDAGGEAHGVASFRTIDSTSYSGFNIMLGFLYTSEKFRTGLTLRTPFILNATSDSTLYMEPTVNELPASPGGTFVADTIYIDRRTSKIQMPLMLGYGIAYNIFDNWLVSTDVEYRGFKGKTVKNLDSLKITSTGDLDEYFSPTDSTPNWSNVIQVRFGTEYLLDTKFGEVPLRFGVRTEVFPNGDIVDYTVKYESENSVSGTQITDGSSYYVDNRRVSYNFKYDTNKITGYSISAGTGIHWSQILLDFAVTYTTYNQKIYQGDGNLRSKNRWRNYHFNFGFVGYF